MNRLILIKYGELTTKKGNRNFFIKTLTKNIEHKLSNFDVKIKKDLSRMCIYFNDCDLKKIIDTIKDILKELFKVSIIDTNGKMKKHFYYRNLLAHRNGRKKDGGYINITNEELKSLITDTQSIAKQIQTKIKPEH